MRFRAEELEAIARGEVTLAFRRWPRPRLGAGSRQRTPVGELAIHAVDQVDEPTDADARGAGFTSAAALFAAFPGDAPLWRIAFTCRENPRIALREALLGAGEIDRIRSALTRLHFDAAAYLRLIADNPGTRAPDLAAGLGLEIQAFKRQVRRLKEHGLTESLAVGYRLSPRGRAVLGGMETG